MTSKNKKQNENVEKWEESLQNIYIKNEKSSTHLSLENILAGGTSKGCCFVSGNLYKNFLFVITENNELKYNIDLI